MFALGAGVCPVFGQFDPNDPWPAFGHDERHACRSVYRGPHCEPQLRWWAEFDALPLHLDPNMTLEDDIGRHVGGVVIGRIGGERRVAVNIPTTDRSGRLYTYRFHPSNPSYDPQLGPADPVNYVELGYGVNSNPLILPNDWVVAQTRNINPLDTGNVQCWDMAPVTPQLKWIAPQGASFISFRSSPTFGLPDRMPLTSPRVFAQGTDQSTGQGRLISIHPETGTFTWVADLYDLPIKQAHTATPALGPVQGDPRNFVYCATETHLYPEEAHFFAAFANGSGPPRWKHGIVGREFYYYGALGSPGVFDWATNESLGDVVIGSQDGFLWGFDNWDMPYPWLVWFPVPLPPVMRLLAYTAAITPERDLIFASAGQFPGTDDPPSRIFLWRWGENDPHYQIDSDIGAPYFNRWVFGAPVLDSWFRFFMAAPGDPYSTHGRKLMGFKLIWEQGRWNRFAQAWRYPINRPFIPGLSQDDWPVYAAPVAMDEDGTLIYVGYSGPALRKIFLIAVRPLVADFNGDEVANNFDIDPLVLALNDPTAWNEQYGAVHGINLLGIGDCNNDGVFNSFDIDCLVEAMGQNRTGGEGDWQYFLKRIAELRAKYRK